jgi:D-alanine-D-alanine ligase
MVQCFSYGEAALLERFVTGTEVAVAVVHDGAEPRALPPVEVDVPGGVYDYTARYTQGAASFHCPARLPEDVLDRLRETALQAHALLGLRDLSRMDAVVDEEGRVQILEVNVSPGLTDTSLLPTAVAAEGNDLGAVFAALVDRAVERG